MISSSFTERVKFEKSNKVMTYHGINGLGMRFFCYIVCGLEGYKKMQEDYKSNIAASPKSYGKVIYTDYIAQPNAKATDFLKKWCEENNGTVF